MGDDDHRILLLAVDLLKRLRQAGKGPQIDPGLRFVKDLQPAAAREDRRDLDALDLAAGEGRIHLPVEIVVRAQADLRQVLAAPVLRELLLARGEQEQVVDGDALEARRLLKSVADAETRALGDGQIRHVLSVVDDTALRGLDKAHDDLGQSGLTAAVRPGKDHQLVIGNHNADVLQDVLRPLRGGHLIADVLQLQHGSILLLR